MQPAAPEIAVGLFFLDIHIRTGDPHDSENIFCGPRTCIKLPAVPGSYEERLFPGLEPRSAEAEPKRQPLGHHLGDCSWVFGEGLHTIINICLYLVST